MPNYEEVVANELELKTENGQVVVSSRVVALKFNKEHNKVVRAIENKIESLTRQNWKVENLFIQSEFTHNGNAYKEYLLTRDGFTFIAMGFTGSEADSWKLKYIEAFNKMEQALKQPQVPMSMEDIIIYQMKQSKMMKEQIDQTQAVALEAKAGVEDTKEELQNMRAVISLDTTSWRTDATDLINKIATYRGGTVNIYQETRREVYELLSKRMGVNLEQRLTNKRRRMADEGVCKSKRDKLSKIDVIAEDKKLIEGFVAIVKEMAIRYGIA